jgi:hypothetical protein
VKINASRLDKAEEIIPEIEGKVDVLLHSKRNKEIIRNYDHSY